MTNIYCLSGLGADEQIFRKLEINNARLIHLPWVEYSEQDDLPNYAKRMLQCINEENPIIMGVSFGGMLAIEIAKLVPVKRAILVSSAKGRKEVAHFGTIVKAIVVSEIAPAFVYKMPNKLLFERFGATTDDERELLRGIMKRSDGKFVRWAMKEIQLWKNDVVPDNVLHIHGTADQMILSQNVKPDYWIDGGSHMMVYSKAKEVSSIINNELYTHGRVSYKAY